NEVVVVVSSSSSSSSSSSRNIWNMICFYISEDILEVIQMEEKKMKIGMQIISNQLQMFLEI
ncbi:MAG: hypothetical protein ACWIPI_08080, partial [Polaribacter sp.]